MFFLSAHLCYSQTNYATLKEAKEATKDGYKTSSGWVIKEGDKIKIGTGSTGNKVFAYIYNAPGITLDISRTPLPTGFAHKNATVKNITFNGFKKTGYTPIIVVGMGVLNNFQIEIDNAITSGEVLVPAEFAKKEATVSSAPAASMADELKKLKDLLDSGAITKEEYETMKKKVIGQ
ncbi:hypothetical protein GFS24_12290 [Chitinophaga sp. SYP-B3965]|nr:hypothetical protein [Chitinophaga sp. SYP-B3965]